MTLKVLWFLCAPIVWFVSFLTLFVVAVYLNSVLSYLPDKQYRTKYIASDGTIQGVCPGKVSPLLQVGDQRFDHDFEECAVQELVFEIGNKERSLKLAYIEAENDPWLRVPFVSKKSKFHAPQVSAAVELIKASTNPYVVVFVHGWRHDARICNGNLDAFRLMLGYSRRFLDQRSDDENDLIGIYVGWRGSVVSETPNTECGSGAGSSWQSLRNFLFSVRNVLSFWDRQAKSDQLGEELGDVLKKLMAAKKAAGKGNKYSKMLVVGHSMGGNMVMSAVTDTLVAQIGSNAAGEVFSSDYGDLLVLLNPASQADRWIKLQEAMRARTGDEDYQTTKSLPSELWTGSKDTPPLFTASQRPVLMSITAACNRSNADQDSKRKYSSVAAIAFFENPCDRATGLIFPVGKYASYNWEKEEHTAIGHYTPDYVSGRRNPVTDPYGQSHQMVLNAAYKPTSWRHLLQPDGAECVALDGALAKARNRASGHGYWDSGYKSGQTKSRALFPHHSKQAKYNTQIRRGAFRANEEGVDEPKNTIVPRNAPFWNIAAFNSISGHNTFVVYPTWCFINQFVLDDITGPAGQAAVTETQERIIQ